MDAKTGTRLLARTIKEGQVIDCRDWLEFAVLEVKYNGIRVRYREFDKHCTQSLQLPADRKPV